LTSGSPSSSRSNREAFRQGLRAIGYVEGQNITIEYRYAEGKENRLPDLAANLVHLKVDVIVVGGSQVISAVKNATGTIPVVMGASSDPVGTGLVASLARPGGNITGLTLLSPELSGKRLELLKETVPGVSRIAALSHPANPASALMLRETREAARSLGVQLQILEVRGADEFDNAFEAAKKDRAGALNVLGAAFLTAHRKKIVELAAKNRLPAIYNVQQFVEDGGLIFYGPNIPDMFRRATTFVDKILKGAKPADLPVEQPMKFELVINLKTAKQIGLTVPPHVLARADKVIR
jgi:putative ABC transport system substrate-binding protein